MHCGWPLGENALELSSRIAEGNRTSSKEGKR